MKPTQQLFSAYFAAMHNRAPKFNQSDMAEAFGVSAPTVSYWKSGKVKMPAHVIDSMARAVGTPALPWIIAIEAQRADDQDDRAALDLALADAGGLPDVERLLGSRFTNLNAVDSFTRERTVSGATVNHLAGRLAEERSEERMRQAGPIPGNPSLYGPRMAALRKQWKAQDYADAERMVETAEAVLGLSGPVAEARRLAKRRGPDESSEQHEARSMLVDNAGRGVTSLTERIEQILGMAEAPITDSERANIRAMMPGSDDLDRVEEVIELREQAARTVEALRDDPQALARLSRNSSPAVPAEPKSRAASAADAKRLAEIRAMADA